MNSVQAQSVVDSFVQIGCANIQYEPLWKIGYHYSNAQCRIMFLVPFTSQEDICLAYLLFGQTGIPTIIVSDRGNPYPSCFTNNITTININGSKSGNTKLIVDALKGQNNFALLFAMSDAKHNSYTVRSGYFYIAQMLQLPMAVLGFDHVQQNVFVSEKRWTAPKPSATYADFRTTTEPAILEAFSSVYPLCPESQVGFDKARYAALHPNVTLEAKMLNLKVLETAVVGASFSKNEMLAIIIITLLFVMLFVVIFLYVPVVNESPAFRN